MITKIKVNGFRSLKNFEMAINPGLNILIGPNGAGKTNIILFFEFLTALFTNRVSEAVNYCGGAGAIFSKSGAEQKTRVIDFEISGETTGRRYGDSEDRYVLYTYRCTIEFADDLDLVFYRRQIFNLATAKSREQAISSWDLELKADFNPKDNVKFKASIEKIDLRKVRLHPMMDQGDRSSRQGRISHLEKTYLDHLLDRELPLVLGLQRLFEEVRYVLSDFLGGQSLNVVPSTSKMHEDSATPPGIRKDGSGLAATLYALAKHERIALIDRRSRSSVSPTYKYSLGTRIASDFFYSRGAFSRIKEYMSLVNSEISDLLVEKDHEDNKLKIFVIMNGAMEKVRLPFSFMSDGTVKWTALVAAIFTNKNMFAVEEPENFIHPHMQQEIVKLMRDVSGRRVKDGYFILMTTHSETLLNAASPDEVAVVSMHDGATSVRRPREVELIRSEINESGFGLGYMYLTGILNDA